MSVKNLLLADDDMDDIFFMSEYIKQHPGYNLLSTVENGAEVISFLETITNEKAKLPDVIVLDQNMPRMTGLQTLHFLKSSSAYAHIPVIIYSTYIHDKLIADCTNSGAVLVAAKPETLEGYKKLMEDMNNVIA